MSAPAVSVLMAVRDGAPWVREAVESVLTQTAGDLELIVIDDGSTDGTPGLLEAVPDPRLRLERGKPRGLTPALNRALGLARAPLVARLDADDLALPERLARQRVFLDAHPEVGLLGTAAREVDGAGREVRVVRPPEDDAALRRALIRENPFVHSSVMLRRWLCERAGGYDETLPVAQDYDLWMRLSRATRMANLRDVLVVRRLLPGRVSIEREGDRLRTEARVRWQAIRRGDYPWRCAVHALRPAAALALPAALRRGLRAALGR
ncbi:MAG: glycosyltransferase [Candidatus Rokubacteria bacterium]|nr:glycosyltransferase [Candidatus Rokubacteria bacterium]MBI3105862.1 glycosyltransferase [Candidatus Rokubacteria bacterium]